MEEETQRRITDSPLVFGGQGENVSCIILANDLAYVVCGLDRGMLSRAYSGLAKDQPNELLFGILNEPNGAMGAAQWNPIVLDVLAIIRETNPERNVVIGSPDWNKITTLGQLELPEDDRHIIVTFRYYDPFQFTHQGAAWVAGSDAWVGTTWEGDLVQKQAIKEYLD